MARSSVMPVEGVVRPYSSRRVAARLDCDDRLIVALAEKHRIPYSLTGEGKGTRRMFDEAAIDRLRPLVTRSKERRRRRCPTDA